MNFFQHQDEARRKTGLLIALFIVALIGIIAMATLLIAGTIWYGAGDSVSIAQYGLGHYITLELLFKTALGVSGVIGAVIFYKWLQLRDGGKVIAERLGGRLIDPDSDDFEERQALNVVEEMAIAAGLPVPPVYILNENGINAFAAGNNPSNAVIGITRSAIRQLNREQLQGVIAHEFSHILHGDMSINLRLIAVLAGILFIGQAGHALLRGSSRSRSRSKNGSQGAILGIGLVLIGFVGTFFGKMIKAAVSRQREYLADASAVQYTRNPDGIAGALKVIGGATAGSLLQSTHADESSHLLFSNGLSFNLNTASAMSTHPPLSDRIQRIQPGWDGRFITQQIRSETEPSSSPSAMAGLHSAADVSASSSFSAQTDLLTDPIDAVGQITAAAVSNSGQLINSLPSVIRIATRDSYQARSVILAMLLDQHNSIIKEEQLRQAETDLTLRGQIEQLSDDLNQLLPQQRFPLIELCIPALKQLTPMQYQEFGDLMKFFMERDGKISLFEWMLQTLLQHYLQGEFTDHKAVQKPIKSLRLVDTECVEIITLLAQQGHNDYQVAQKSFEQAIFILELGSGFSLPKSPVNLNRASRHLSKLTTLTPRLKEQLLKAIIVCIKKDQQITVKERELFRVISALLDCPTAL